MSVKRHLACSALAAALLAAAGCGPADPLAKKVSARTQSGFASWRAQIASDAGTETRRQVNLALDEIRLKASAEREADRRMGRPIASGGEGLDEAVREKVDGRTLREVVQLGYELREQRLARELAALEDAMKMNAQLVTRPGDVESRQHLDGVRDRQQGRVDTYRADLAATQRELAPLLKVTGRRLVEAPTDTPDQMPQPVKRVAPK